jgi:hypothetical protein
MLVVPLKILSPEMLPVSAALPVTERLPLITTVAALAVKPSKVIVSVFPTDWNTKLPATRL